MPHSFYENDNQNALSLSLSVSACVYFLFCSSFFIVVFATAVPAVFVSQYTERTILNLCSVIDLLKSSPTNNDDEDENATYTLTFNIEFPHENDTIYFAHSYPYTYSDLQVSISRSRVNLLFSSSYQETRRKKIKFNNMRAPSKSFSKPRTHTLRDGCGCVIVPFFRVIITIIARQTFAEYFF